MSHHLVNQFIHIMWSTQNQKNIIFPVIKTDLYAYITSIVKARNGRVFAIGGCADHVHLLILLPPDVSLSTLIGYIKACSSKWLKSKDGADPHFTWQNGYLGMSTQEDRLDHVCSYIRSDEIRHQTKNHSYSEELKSMLKRQNIEYNERYFLENSHSKIYVHAVWSTHNRHPCLNKDIRHNLYNQVIDVVTGGRGIVHAIGGIEDHVHILMEMPKDKALSDLIRDVKTSSTHWLKSRDGPSFPDFEWQVGYGAFTVSYSSIEDVKRYIVCQEKHHQKQTTHEEWNEFLQKNGCNFRFVEK